LKTSTKRLSPEKIRPLLLVSLMIFLCGASSCTTGISWNPNFYKASSVAQSIKDKNENEVMCYDIKFDQFACLHQDKIKELAEILERARIPKEDKDNILKLLHSTLEGLKQEQQ